MEALAGGGLALPLLPRGPPGLAQVLPGVRRPEHGRTGVAVRGQQNLEVSDCWEGFC